MSAAEGQASTEVRIALPLPLSLAGDIMSMFGQRYPHTAIRTDDPLGGLVLVIPDEDRFACEDQPVEIDPAPKLNLADKEMDINLTELSDRVFGVDFPAELTEYMVDLARGVMEQFPEAENYLELAPYDPEVGHRWIVTVQRGNKRSPHELRLAAEARAERAEKALRQAFSAEALAYLASCPDPNVAGEVSNLIVSSSVTDED